MNGNCNCAHQPRGTCKETFIKTSMNRLGEPLPFVGELLLACYANSATCSEVHKTPQFQHSTQNTGCPKVCVYYDTPLFSGLGKQIMKSFDVVNAE